MIKLTEIFPLIIVALGVLLFGGGLVFDESRTIVKLWPYEIIGIFILVILAFVYQLKEKSIAQNSLP